MLLLKDKNYCLHHNRHCSDVKSPAHPRDFFMPAPYPDAMKHLLLQAALLALSFTAPAQTTHPRTTHKTVTHHAAAKVKVKTKARLNSGPKVYYCNSGNTVKYHATPGCRGLARCNAAVVSIGLAAAQQRMDPCKWCY